MSTPGLPQRERAAAPLAASMSLLVDLASRDDGYVEAARRRAAAPPRASRLRIRGALGLLLAAALISAALVNVRNQAPATARARAALARQVEQQTVRTDGLQSQLDVLRRQVATERSAALATSKDGATLGQQTAALEAATGADAVSGPGVRVSLADAPRSRDPQGIDRSSGGLDQPGQGTVLDRDIQDVVNALWAAGAEAIAVNGQRLTVQSAIRSAGEAILVDFRPISPPYVISAVGDPATLEINFTDSPTARRFRTYTSAYGLGFAVRPTGRLELPAASALTLRHARPADGPS